MRRKTIYRWGIVAALAVLLSITGHLYVMIQKGDGLLMTGINDGLSQMVPFKKFVYEHYTSGNFFYSDSFGLGGGFFSQLGYYYSTNILFLVFAGFIFLLELLHIIGTPDLFFWMDAILPMSILKLALIIVAATVYFRKISFGMTAAFLGAAVYALNVLYFRHAMYWDFFTDAMFWFIILLIGIEKVIRKESKSIFVLAVAANLITNFYFAYVNFLLGFFYILLRFVIKFKPDEEKIGRQIGKYCYLGIIGFLISSFAFIPSVVGYLENYRPEYTDGISLLYINDNILLNSRVLFLPIFVMIILFFARFYKYPAFRFFAILSIAGTVLHFVPFIHSMFNGFSAPQQRWEHIVCLAYGGIVAYFFQHLKKVRIRDVCIGVAVFALLAIAVIYIDRSSIDRPAGWVIPVMSTLIALLFLLIKKISFLQMRRIFAVSISAFMVISANVFAASWLMPPGGENLASEEFIHSDQYNSQEQRELLSVMEERKATEHSRIDWMAPTRNNTPMVQDYNGMSLYSSILNENILFFYYYFAEISMDRESTSRYATLGDRTNLMSLFNGQFYMRDKETETVPYGFTKVAENAKYHAYENNFLLPAFRKTNEFYNSEALLEQSVLTREHAMLSGAITENAGSGQSLNNNSEIHDYTMEEVNATYDGSELTIHEEHGGLEIRLDDSYDEGDLYVSFYLDGIRKESNFMLEVNEYQTQRKASNHIYETNANDLTVRIAADDTINLKLPKGKYELKELQIFHEDYQVLRDAYEEYQEEEPLNINWDHGQVQGNVVSEEENELIVTPIPYEKGWSVKVNGKEVPIEKVNYAFIGIPLEMGENEIEMTYLPPYFGWTTGMTVLGVVLLGFLYYRERRRSFNMA